jgi:hypothetical protein
MEYKFATFPPLKDFRGVYIAYEICSILSPLDPPYPATSNNVKMSSEQFPPNDSTMTHPKFTNRVLHEDLDAAQHTPLYPSLGRIGYVPNVELYEARVRASMKRLQEKGTLSSLPKGWPTIVKGPMAWTGEELQTSSEWIYNLSNKDIAEIRSGLLYCKGEPSIDTSFRHFTSSRKSPLADKAFTVALKKDLSGVNKTTFPLPHLGDRLRGLSTEVHTGRGFFILRGLNPAEFAREENVILYLGISSYVAEQRGRQNHEGSLICKSYPSASSRMLLRVLL